jgi:CO/xanthine dehydrogenase Mo-binding subunit
MNDDGSFNLLVGATDLGTGSDTVLAQMAAEVLGVPVEDIMVYSSDTDFTPFDKGAYASSTTYISGGAVVRAAEQAAIRIRQRAARMLKTLLKGSLETGKDELHDLQPEEVQREHADCTGENRGQHNESPLLLAFAVFHQSPSLSACLKALKRFSRANRNGATIPL